MGTLRDELTTIYKRRGLLTAPAVVEEATPEDHPLHHRFEWDDSVAGPKYREAQAAELIRSVRIQFTAKDGPADVRAYSLVRDPASRSTYVPTEQALGDEFTRTLILRDMERDWRTFQRRYEHMAEFAEMIRRDLAV